LIRARLDGVIAALKPLLDQLIAAGFHLDPPRGTYTARRCSTSVRTDTHDPGCMSHEPPSPQVGTNMSRGSCVGGVVDQSIVMSSSYAAQVQG
jgi:hypothetical protein